MISNQNNKIVIIGGGLAGLTCALLLNRAGFEVTVVERKIYPFHRVCGEYISNEVRPFLKSLNIDIDFCEPSEISKLAVSSPSGKLFTTKLDLGGFGLSRYKFDNLLFEKATENGVQFLTGTKVNNIHYQEDEFEIELSDNSKISSNILIAAYGKRSNLDCDRPFFRKRSPYLGVKYHIHCDFPTDLVQLDNFEGGYCGTVKIEEDRYNLCYLSENRHLKKYGSIEAVEKHILSRNPFLNTLFSNADFLGQKPEVINEISFAQKPLVDNHILYCGDAAGMISPLCGNGMAMAIHSAKLLCDAIVTHYLRRETLEAEYCRQWKSLFQNRLRLGRLTQRLFGREILSELAIQSLILLPSISAQIIKRTHGRPF